MKHWLAKASAWVRKIQGEVVLPTARTIYLAIACVSLAGAIGALLVALVLQLEAWQSPSRTPVPAVAAVAVPPINSAIIDQKLAPPTNIRFVVLGPLTEKLVPNRILGHFEASSPNGYPKFSIIGGKDAHLFRLTGARYPGVGDRAILQPSPDLIEAINGNPLSFKKLRSHSYSIRVFARDRYGNATPAVVVQFVLQTGPANAPQAPAAQSAQSSNSPTPVKEATPLEKLAGQIALLVDPKHSALFFNTYERARQLPNTCGTFLNNSDFLRAYTQGFATEKAKLSAANVSGFFAGMCDAWKQAVTAQASRQNAESAAHNRAIAANAQAASEAAVATSVARAGRNTAMSFAGAAIGAFITISLFLAFLAMENHTKAVREAIEALAQISGGMRKEPSGAAENGGEQ